MARKKKTDIAAPEAEGAESAESEKTPASDGVAGAMERIREACNSESKAMSREEYEEFVDELEDYVHALQDCIQEENNA